MNDIEEKLWEYIDGNCTPDEHAAIGMLIATDEIYKQKYNELLQLDGEFKAMELDEPSMAFTYNVMEAVRAETALKPLKAAINTRIIWGIAAFFILSITALLITVFASMDWHQTGHASTSIPQFTMPPVAQYFNSNVFKGFILFDMVLGLYVLDSYLRKKLNNKQAD